jgi:hypothetical protein
MNAIVKINVGRSSLISLDKRACTGADKAVTRFIPDCVVGFRFNNNPGTRIPIELAPDEITGAAQWITLEKICPEHFAPSCSDWHLVHFSGL